MSQKILIKYASRSRPQWFRKAIANIYNTISDRENFQIIVAIDDTDMTMSNVNMIDFIRQHEEIVLIGGHSDDKVHAINRNIHSVPHDWDILVVMSDDMHFTHFGWDNTIRQRMKDNFPDGDCFLHFNDGYVKDALATMSIMDRKYYERDLYIYHPSYKSFSCDAEAFYVALMRGRHRYFDEILATHQHPSNAKIPNDELYAANSLHTPHDTRNYFERLKRYFDEPSGHDILKARPELKNYL